MSVVFLTSSSRVVTPDIQNAEVPRKHAHCGTECSLTTFIIFTFIISRTKGVPEVNNSFKQIINASLNTDLQIHAKRRFIQM
jgi:hypothetical protein